jgi:hypothetical protein
MRAPNRAYLLPAVTFAHQPVLCYAVGVQQFGVSIALSLSDGRCASVSDRVGCEV